MAKDLEDVIRVLIGFSKIPDADGDIISAVEYDLKNVDLNNLRKIFNIDPIEANISARDILGPVDVNREQAMKLQTYVIDGAIEFDKYTWELRCYEKPDETMYTVKEIEDALFFGKDYHKTPSYMLVQFASLHDKVDDIIYIFNKTSHVKDTGVKCARIVMLMEIISRGLPIEDDLLFNFLELGINDRYRGVSNNSKRTANMLKQRNPALFKRLSDKYDLEEIY